MIVTDLVSLREVSRNIARGSDIRQLAADLLDAMLESHGLAVSGVQIGKPFRMLVMQKVGMKPICLVNPEVKKTKGQQRGPEGCLSFPGKLVAISRPMMVRVDGFNQYWTPVRYRFQGMEARCFFHELDHMNGKLIIDYEGGSNGT